MCGSKSLTLCNSGCIPGLFEMLQRSHWTDIVRHIEQESECCFFIFAKINESPEPVGLSNIMSCVGCNLCNPMQYILFPPSLNPPHGSCVCVSSITCGTLYPHSIVELCLQSFVFCFTFNFEVAVSESIHLWPQAHSIVQANFYLGPFCPASWVARITGLCHQSACYLVIHSFIFSGNSH